MDRPRPGRWHLAPRSGSTLLGAQIAPGNASSGTWKNDSWREMVSGEGRRMCKAEVLDEEMMTLDRESAAWSRERKQVKFLHVNKSQVVELLPELFCFSVSLLVHVQAHRIELELLVVKLVSGC